MEIDQNVHSLDRIQSHIMWLVLLYLVSWAFPTFATPVPEQCLELSKQVKSHFSSTIKYFVQSTKGGKLNTIDQLAFSFSISVSIKLNSFLYQCPSCQH
jgi:hypothetical protein